MLSLNLQDRAQEMAEAVAAAASIPLASTPLDGAAEAAADSAQQAPDVPAGPVPLSLEDSPMSSNACGGETPQVKVQFVIQAGASCCSRCGAQLEENKQDVKAIEGL